MIRYINPNNLIAEIMNNFIFIIILLSCHLSGLYTVLNYTIKNGTEFKIARKQRLR